MNATSIIIFYLIFCFTLWPSQTWAGARHVVWAPGSVLLQVNQPGLWPQSREEARVTDITVITIILIIIIIIVIVILRTSLTYWPRESLSRLCPHQMSNSEFGEVARLWLTSTSSESHNPTPCLEPLGQAGLSVNLSLTFNHINESRESHHENQLWGSRIITKWIREMRLN